MRAFRIALIAVLPAATLQAQGKTRSTTSPAITTADLRSRIYAFADDSMRGRRAGTADALRASAYIAREAQRIGLQPGGDGGTFFQAVPFAAQWLDTTSTFAVNGQRLRVGTDWIASAPLGHRGFRGTLEIVNGGNIYDTLNLVPADVARGRLLVVHTAPFPPNSRGLLLTEGWKRYVAMVTAAAAYVVIYPQLPANQVRNAMSPPDFAALRPDTQITDAVNLAANDSIAAILLGAPMTSAPKGLTRMTATLDIRFSVVERPDRNVVAVLPGRDRKLRSEYVALGAHLDHIGVRLPAVDHDSLRAYLSIARVQGADGAAKRLTPEDSVSIRTLMDTLHRARAHVVLDSIANGADDDGSGAMSLLEIAESFAGNRPRRSLLFVWHTGEESGMLGSQYFTDHPTVTRDSIVAQLNVDMIGRGQASDVTGRTADRTLLHGRDEGYLQVIGSRRLSTELGDLIDTSNVRRSAALQIDYSMDAAAHPQMMYCRSDHWQYARYGIPIAFFTTGGHRDYHQVTDEPQYLYYDNYLRVTQFIHDVAARVANLDHRPLVDKPVPGPTAVCRQ
jgi:hypothetical protein